MDHQNSSNQSSELMGTLEGVSGSLAPAIDWHEVGSANHFVQFYETDAFLLESVSEFIGAGLESGGVCIVIGTPGHREALEQILTIRGLNIAEMKANGRYIARDAAETMSAFMVNGSPDQTRFQENVGSIVTQAIDQGKPVRVFGEMVALLWTQGNQDAALRLENFWHELTHIHPFTLFCAYPMEAFNAQTDEAPFSEVCSRHSQVVPSESYAALSPGERLREIARLQQQAKRLNVEIERRKKVEQSLFERNRELYDFLESAAEGIRRVGPDGVILWANRAELALLGYSSEEYVGHSIDEFLADADEAQKMLANLESGEAVYQHTIRMKCKDGSLKEALVHSKTCFEGGQFFYTRSLTPDLIEQKRIEIERHRLAAIVDSSNDAIISKTLDGIITSWNKAAERMFGYTEAEAVGRPKTIVFPQERLQEEETILARLRRGEGIDHFESVRVRKDGRQIDVSLSISPVKDSQGVIVGASTIIRDITLAKQQQRELEALNMRLKRAMMETHHRVKNNLQIIAAMMEIKILEHSGDKIVPMEEFERLKSHIFMLAVVHEMLTQSVKETEHAQRLSVKEVFEKLLPLLQQTAGTKTVRFTVEEVELSSKQCVSLALVLNELVSNAIKHGNSEAEISFETQNGEAILEVCDNGPGFPPGFDPLACAHTGLELVDSLVHTDLMGKISYGNREDGGGRVRAVFPLPKTSPALEAH